MREMKEIPRENNARRKKYWKRQRQIVHHDRIIPACSPSFSSSYLVDTDREFTAKSVLTRKSLWKCSWGPGADTLKHTGMRAHTHTHTHIRFLNLPYPLKLCSLCKAAAGCLSITLHRRKETQIKRGTSKEARTRKITHNLPKRKDAITPPLCYAFAESTVRPHKTSIM